MVRRITLSLVLFLAYGSAVFAASYFEFNPDYAQSLLGASSGSVEQVFVPANEYFSGVDFWVSNAGSAGSATFTLLTSSGTTITQRTVSVPAIADSENGTRFHFDWPSQLPIAARAISRVRIDTASPPP